MTDDRLIELGAQSADLVVLDRVAGELVNLNTVSEVRLAELVETIAAQRAELDEEDRLVNRELLDRLDRRGEWTLRVGNPDDGVQWEITAASKTAGTVGYDVDTLREALIDAIADDTIDPVLARAALKRSVSIVAYVNPHVDLDALATTVQGLTAIGQVQVHDVKVSVTEAAADAGIKRLAKAGGRAIVDAVTVDRAAPPRRVKVKAKRRETR